MHLLQDARPHPPVPTGLVAAAIDFILIARPASDQLEPAIAALAIKLGYSADTAISVSARITASLRMFGNPAWPTIKALRSSLDLHDSLIFVHATQRFIAKAPLGGDVGFEVAALARSLIVLLPARGAA